MKKTGYVVVDCTGIDLAAEEKVTIDGIFAAFTDAVNCGKPIFAENIVGDDDAFSPANVVVYPSSGDYVFALGGATITIDNEDGVTIS